MKNLSKTLSFKDIAELSNVSVSTVVRVMKSCREAVRLRLIQAYQSTYVLMR